MPYSSLYSGTKAFDSIFAIALREELKAHNIHIMLCKPSAIETEFDVVAGVDQQFYDNAKKSGAMGEVKKSTAAFIDDNRRGQLTSYGNVPRLLMTMIKPVFSREGWATMNAMQMRIMAPDILNRVRQ